MELYVMVTVIYLFYFILIILF